MAEFPPNLDDGEMWIPSDVLPKEAARSAEVYQHFGSSNSSSPFRNHNQQLSFMAEGLARQVSTMALLDHRPQIASKTLLHSPPQWSGRAAIQHTGAAPTAIAGHGLPLRPGFDMGPYGGLGTGFGYLAQGPLPEYGLLKPVQFQAKGWTENRGAAANGQLKAPQNCLQSRLSTPHGGGVKLDIGFHRECEGTGVFFPRITTTIVAAPSTHKTTNDDGAKKKQGRKNGQHAQSQQWEETAKRSSFDKQEECQREFPADLGLPKDWTY